MTKNLLILGSGGREHALAKRFSHDTGVDRVFVMPGNPGMENSSNIKCVEGSLKDFEFISDFVKDQAINLIIVGPEDPLANGIVDYFNDINISILGPTRSGALLESSKAFSKDFMTEFNIPTAAYASFNDFEVAHKDLEENSLWEDGVVVKASSLAAGKGVFVCTTRSQASKALFDIMMNDDFSVSSETVVLETILKGKELSAFALCDGTSFITMGYACDHKRLLDDDLGPNTGGMGTYTPEGWPSAAVKEKINIEVFQRVLDGMNKRGTPFKGILFAGLMIDQDDVQVIEYNVRFGDPEAQVIMPTIKGNLAANFLAAAKGDLSLSAKEPLRLSSDVAIHVVKVSQGYPALDGNPMLKNQEITEDKKLSSVEGISLYCAGVAKKEGKLVNSGGRVLGLTAIASDLKQARELVYENIDLISFEGAFWRKDIGSK